MSQTALSSSPQKIAGRYAVLGVLGKGGMASVYRALDESRGCEVAVKRLANTGAAAAALFEAEFHTLAGLKHPAIIEVFDYGVDSEGPYYVMELLDGGDVAGLTPMPWQDVCACLRDVGGALALVHRRELVHRDISPRNVWRTASGHFKVIDFGALTKFGIPDSIVGTPAFIAPECVAGEPLDQRSDLYSLGAVAYYLLTGRRPQAVYTLEDILSPQPKPLPPSTFVTHVVATDHAEPAPMPSSVSSVCQDLPIPAELDTLVMSLLSRTLLARPFSAAEVIDRAASIASVFVGGSPSARPQGLVSTGFFGRDAEMATLRDAVARLSKGAGAAILVEGPEGQGKTRLLHEAKLDARVAGVTVLPLDARLCRGHHGGAVQLAKALLDAKPERSRELGAPLAGTLSHLSREIATKLGAVAEDATAFSTPGEMRMRVQDALFAWFTAVAKEERIAIFVDDVDELDDASSGFVAALGRSARDSGILVVASCTKRDGAPGSGDGLKVLHAVARIVSLGELSLAATKSLLRSAFGDVPNLPRVADKLHERCRGNPQHCMDLVHHLVREDAIRHHDGAWILPFEIPDEKLPDSSAAVARRVDRLSPLARDVARVLVLDDVFSVDLLCTVLPGEEPGRLSGAVDELLVEGVATGTRAALRLARRYAPHVGALHEMRARQVHQRLAAVILARSPLFAADQLTAGMHLLRAGDEERGGRLLARGGIDIINQTEALPAVLPALESALSLYKQKKRPAAELAPLLGALAAAAYYCDHRLAARYGDEAIELLRDLVGLTRAARWRRFLGEKLSLYLSLALAAIRLKRAAKSGRAPTLKEAFALFFGAVATLTGVYVIYIDRARALRTAEVLAPLQVLGKNHVASFMYEFSKNLAMTIDNASGQARSLWRRMLDRLRNQEEIRGFPTERRQLYLGGALYACGVIESWADGPGALAMADELDAMGMKLYAMSADQVRALYWANQGIVERFQHYRERVETHAIQRGTAWQVEIWWHGALIGTHLRGHDAMGMKHTQDVLDGLASEIPSLRLYSERARGAYALMRGRYSDAISTLEAASEGDNRFVVGANRNVAMLARAYNTSREPARAKELCEAAIAAMDQGDRELVVMNQLVFTELALAEARLGNFDAAERMLDELLDGHLPLEGPLTIGTLYETKAQVARLRKDRVAARSHLEQMAAWYEKTKLPSLAARSELLLSSAHRQATPGPEALVLPDTDDVSETMIFED